MRRGGLQGYITKRLIYAVLITLGVVTITFILLRVGPVSPADKYLANMSARAQDPAQVIAAIEANVTDMVITIDTPTDGTEIYPDAAWMGRKFGQDPWLTWKWKQLKNIVETGFGNTDLNTILNNKGNTVQKQGGIVYTIEGKVTGDRIKFIDILIGIDQIKADLEKDLLQLFLDNESVPITDRGIEQVEQVLRGALDRNANLGIIADINEDSSDEDKAKSDQGFFMYKVVVPKRSDLSVEDRGNRVLNKVKFSYTVAGAVHSVDVDGVFEV